MEATEPELEDELTSFGRSARRYRVFRTRSWACPVRTPLDYRIYPGALLIVLADGAGSAERADLGARCAVDTALEVLSAGLGDDPEQDAAA